VAGAHPWNGRGWSTTRVRRELEFGEVVQPEGQGLRSRAVRVLEPAWWSSLMEMAGMPRAGNPRERAPGKNAEPAAVPVVLDGQVQRACSQLPKIQDLERGRRR
jgi:hypothetical protein